MKHTGDTPTVTASNRVSNAYSCDNVGASNVTTGWGNAGAIGTALETLESIEKKLNRLNPVHAAAQAMAFNPQPQPKAETPIMTSQRRIVQVFIADTNDNVPLDDSVLYQGKEKLTDLNDMELYFEVPMQEILKAHNEKRVKWLDKEATKRSGKDVFLEAVKIRDLKMAVVVVATF